MFSNAVNQEGGPLVSALNLNSIGYHCTTEKFGFCSARCSAKIELKEFLQKGLLYCSINAAFRITKSELELYGVLTQAPSLILLSGKGSASGIIACSLRRTNWIRNGCNYNRSGGSFLRISPVFTLNIWVIYGSRAGFLSTTLAIPRR